MTLPDPPPPRWLAHAYDVKPATARHLVVHLSDEYDAPMCGDPPGVAHAELGSKNYPGSANVLACVACLLLSTPNPKESTDGR